MKHVPCPKSSAEPGQGNSVPLFYFFFKPVNLLFIYFFANFIYLCIILHLFLAVLSFSCCAGFSLVAGSRGYSLVVVHRIFIVVASLVSEHVL